MIPFSFSSPSLSLPPLPPIPLSTSITRSDLESPRHVVVLFDFVSTSKGEISVKQGDLLSVISYKHAENGWLVCSRHSDSLTGLIAKEFTIGIPFPPHLIQPNKRLIAYQPNRSKVLANGDDVHALYEYENGWIVVIRPPSKGESINESILDVISSSSLISLSSSSQKLGSITSLGTPAKPSPPQSAFQSISPSFPKSQAPFPSAAPPSSTQIFKRVVDAPVRLSLPSEPVPTSRHETRSDSTIPAKPPPPPLAQFKRVSVLPSSASVIGHCVHKAVNHTAGPEALMSLPPQSSREPSNDIQSPACVRLSTVSSDYNSAAFDLPQMELPTIMVKPVATPLLIPFAEPPKYLAPPPPPPPPPTLPSNLPSPPPPPPLTTQGGEGEEGGLGNFDAKRTEKKQWDKLLGEDKSEKRRNSVFSRLRFGKRARASRIDDDDDDDGEEEEEIIDPSTDDENRSTVSHPLGSLYDL